MFAACILFALPTIKDEFVKSDRHTVYNSGVHAIGEPRDIFKEMSRHEERMKELANRQRLQDATDTQKADLLDLRLKILQIGLRVSYANYIDEDNQFIPDAALQYELRNQIMQLLDLIDITQTELRKLKN